MHQVEALRAWTVDRVTASPESAHREMMVAADTILRLQATIELAAHEIQNRGEGWAIDVLLGEIGTGEGAQ